LGDPIGAIEGALSRACGGFDRMPIIASADGRRWPAGIVVPGLGSGATGLGARSGAAAAATATVGTAGAPGETEVPGGAPEAARGAIDFRAARPRSLEHDVHARASTGLN
jgi:hypothetical protein